MRRTTIVPLLFLMAAAAGARAAGAAEPDPWRGKSRAEIVTLLGEPHKTTRGAAGAETLTYRLVRLDESAIAPQGMSVLNLPGIGIVGRMHDIDPRDGREVSMGPTELDKRGRGTGGGIEEEQSFDVTWNSDKGQLERSWDERSAIRGRLKLVFELGPAGAIERWSVSPKKRAAASGAAPATEPAGAASVPVPTREQLANMIFEGVRGHSFALEDGRYEGEPAVLGGSSRLIVELLDELTLFGDLDADGTDDAAVLLVESSGGSGARVWLSAVSGRFGVPASYGCALVGDRPQIRSMRVREGRIRLAVVDGGPGDPACCPTHRWTKDWAVVDGQLIQVAAVMDGVLTLGEIGGQEWVLTHFDQGSPAPREPAISARIEGRQVAGSSGCNQYFAAVRETSPTAIEIGAVGGTKMICPPETMEVERSFLERLGRVSRYGFRNGKLALSWQAEQGPGTLLFEPRPSPASN